MKNTITFFFVQLLAFLVGLSSCFFLHHNLSLSSVASAAFVGLVGSFIPHHKVFETHPRGAVYTGAFAGMCSAELIQNTTDLFLISFIGALIYTTIKSHLFGLGGKLGAIAFSAVAIVVLLKQGVM